MRAWLHAALLVGSAATLCRAQQGPELRPLTLAELESIDPTTPILRITMGAIDPANAGWLYGTNVWARYGTGPWQIVYRTGEGGADTSQAGQPVFPILLAGTPSAVRVGCVGYYTGSVWVDDIALILPDGSELSPSSVAAINNATAPENAVGLDGKCASVRHLAGATPSTPTVVDAVEAEFQTVPQAFRTTELALPTTPLAPPEFGLYHIAGADTDPHESLPGWHYEPDPAGHAFYDFLMPQSNNPALFAEIRQADPDIKIVARLTWPRTNPLDYFHKPEERKRVEDSIREQLGRGTEGLYGVYLGDEEAQHFFHGWHGGAVPEWATRYAPEYARETGVDFDWDDPRSREWIIEKGRALWEDLYRIIKEVDPGLKVMPFLYVPGDLSGWGFWDPGTIEADGWVYQWYYSDRSVTVTIPLASARAGLTKVLARESWFNAAVHKLVEAGIPLQEIYCQIWGYRPQDDPIDQTERVRAAGLSNVWIFYTCAWLPPKPVVMPALRDGAFRLTAPGEDDPFLVQESADGFVAVGHGLAQRFVAGRESLGEVELRLKATTEVAHSLQLLPDAGGRPGEDPLATASVSPAVGLDEWLAIPLEATLTPGKSYYLALVPDSPPEGVTLARRPEDDATGPLLWAVDFRDPYPGGELVHREVYGEYFNDWRLYGEEAAGTWIGSWRASYEKRLIWESYIRDLRRRQ